MISRRTPRSEFVSPSRTSLGISTTFEFTASMMSPRRSPTCTAIGPVFTTTTPAALADNPISSLTAGLTKANSSPVKIASSPSTVKSRGGSSGAEINSTVTSDASPFRVRVTTAVLPMPPTLIRNNISPPEITGWPSTAVITSPTSKPAAPNGLAG